LDVFEPTNPIVRIEQDINYVAIGNSSWPELSTAAIGNGSRPELSTAAELGLPHAAFNILRFASFVVGRIARLVTAIAQLGFARSVAEDTMFMRRLFIG
jgi:hypothetical protein